MTQDAKVAIKQPGETRTPVVESTQEPVVIDARGRALVLREADVLAPYRLVELVGGAAAENRVYMNMVFPFLYLKSIDGDQIAPPMNKLQLEGLIVRLGHDGVKALRAGVEKHFSTPDETEEKDAIKK